MFSFKNVITLICTFSWLAINLSGQEYSIYGIVSSDKPLSNVQVTIPELNFNTTTNNVGYYEFNNLPLSKLSIEFKHIGYQRSLRNVILNGANRYELNVSLTELIIELSEATVISSRNEQRVKDVSFPIEVINSLKIQNTSSITVSDLVKSESGISVIKDGPWATSINIRGLSKQNIVYLIDGNRIETSTNIAAGLSLIDMSNIQSIEVVKGGLSSLYGTGATGGVVNIISKESQFSNNFYTSSHINSSYNSVNNLSANSLSLNAGSENWTVKINASVRRADDTDTPNGKLENSSFNDESLNLSFKYAPLTNIQFRIDAHKFSAFDVGIPGGAPFPTTATAKYLHAKRDMISGSINFNSISQHLLKANIKYYHQKIDRSVEVKPNKMVTSAPGATHETNGAVIQTDWQFVNNNYFVAGIDYWQRQYNGIRTVTNLAQNIIKADRPVPNSTFKSMGLFIKDEFNLLSEKLNISLSGRYDFIQISNKETKNPLYIINNGNINSNIIDQLASYEAQTENNKSISGGIGSIYKLSNKYDVTFNLGYNFRSPSLEERYQYIDLGGIVYLGNPELKPEEGVFIDAGFRVWEDDFNFRANAFLNSFSNLVQDISVKEDSLYKKQNIGEARLYGFDLRIDYNYYKNYLAYLTLGYVRGKDIIANTNLPEIPPFNGSFGLKIPISGLFNIDLTSTFALQQNDVGDGESKTSGFTYFDMSFISNNYSLNIMSFRIVAGVQNIFNKEYREHLSTYRGLKMNEPGRNIFVKLILDLE